MKKLLVFLGESGSGKTTLIAKLTEQYSDRFKKVVTCTSRPIRTGEIDGIDYHFRPAEYFVTNTSLVLGKKTSEGFHYATRQEDLHSDTHHLLLTSKPTGVAKLAALCRQHIAVVRISISDQLKVQRMRHRGDTEEMIAQRLQTDVEMRTPVDFGAVPILNLEAADPIDRNVDRILEFINN